MKATLSCGIAIAISLLVGCAAAPPRHDLREETARNSDRQISLIEVHDTVSVTSVDREPASWGLRDPLSSHLYVAIPYREAIVEPGVHVFTGFFKRYFLSNVFLLNVSVYG